ncbi:hypothetical protein GQ600_856 [Phytophthora cactorum]|nr:hypothetical protein GQ600_856 [Phytophthora cactorum]
MESYTRTTSKDSNILLESLQILFTTECLVTTAYLEAFMPLFYSSYMVLMVHLPNVRYHLEMAKVTRENIVSTELTSSLSLFVLDCRDSGSHKGNTVLERHLWEPPDICDLGAGLNHQWYYTRSAGLTSWTADVPSSRDRSGRYVGPESAHSGLMAPSTCSAVPPECHSCTNVTVRTF